jgi:hypothetical protein
MGILAVVRRVVTIQIIPFASSFVAIVPENYASLKNGLSWMALTSKLSFAFLSPWVDWFLTILYVTRPTSA